MVALDIVGSWFRKKKTAQTISEHTSPKIALECFEVAMGYTLATPSIPSMI
jgi:hypothetical protein